MIDSYYSVCCHISQCVAAISLRTDSYFSICFCYRSDDRLCAAVIGLMIDSYYLVCCHISQYVAAVSLITDSCFIRCSIIR